MTDHADRGPLAPAVPPHAGLDAATANALLHSAPTPIALCDALGRVEWCNPALLNLIVPGGPGRPGDAVARGQPLALLLGLTPHDAQRLQQALGSAPAGAQRAALADMRRGGQSWRAQSATLADGRRSVHWQAVDAERGPAAAAARASERADPPQDVDRPAAPQRDPREQGNAETAEQLALALTLAHVIVFRHELHSDRVRITERAFEFGLPAGCADLSSAQLRALVHSDDHAALRSASQQALTSALPVDAQIRFRHADGGWRHVLTRRIAQRDAQGQPLALLGVGLDISERVQASEREAELVREFELTARAAGIGYWSVLAHSRQVRWSDQTFALHGLPSGGAAPSTREWLQRFVHPADREAVRERYRRWAKRGGPTLEQELRIVRSDGVTRHLLSYARLEGPPGRYDFFGVLMDVTERRAAEAALHRANERAALATRGAGMGTWELDC
jgi:PAS domain S-box-containing protein